MTRDLEPTNWAHAGALWHVDPDRDAVIKTVEDIFPKIHDVVRRANATMVCAVAFERAFSSVHGVVVICPPAGTGEPFSVVVYGDRLSLNREMVLRAGDDVKVLDASGLKFWANFCERLGKALARAPTTGSAH